MSAAIIAPLLTGAASGLISKFGTRQKTQKQPKFQRELIDQILQGIQGQGPFAGLFQSQTPEIGQEAFQKSIADPLQRQFQTQTAPGIQQRFIASGQQGGTPLDTALARGGLDVQSEIDKLFLPFQQGQQQLQFQGQENASNRLQSMLSTILGIPAPQTQSSITPFGAAGAGIVGSGGIQELISQITGGGAGGGGATAQPFVSTDLRRGFANKNQSFTPTFQ